jgi:uncharacterized membrane protein YqjE
MILPLNLNRRHKVTLFLTVLLAGIAALNGAKMMQVVGILLLGLALAWAFGSDSRVVHWLFLSLGVLLACGTVGLGWYVHQSDTDLYAQKVAAFEQRIPELAKEYPLHKNGQIILDKDLQPYLVKNPKAAGLPPESDTSGWTPVPEPQRESRRQARRPHPPDATVGNSGVTSTLPAFNSATARPLEDNLPKSAPPSESSPHVTWDEPAGWQPVTPSPQTKSSGAPSLQDEWGTKAKPVTALTMPDGHVRYFADKRDAKTCQEDFFAWGKTQKMWNEAWVAGLDLSEVPSPITASEPFNELPGYPPKAPWEHDDWWVCLCLGVFLFALGYGLILGIRAKPLPT